MEPVNQKQQPSVFDKKDIQSLLIDIEKNRKVTGPPVQQAIQGTADTSTFQDLLNKVQNRTNG
jgi:hypothetical protein